MKTLWRILLVILLLGIGGLYILGTYTTQLFESAVNNFSSEKVASDFRSYMITTKGTQRFQFAELQQIEVIKKISTKRLFWNQLKLPDIAVRLEVPVNYTYYIDLDTLWEWSLTEEGIEVSIPPIQFNPPAPNVSQLKIIYEKSSALRDERQLARRIVSQLTNHLNMRAEQNIDLVEEQAKEQLQRFIKTWIKKKHPELQDKPIKLQLPQ